jgi:hypothetical protein
MSARPTAKERQTEKLLAEQMSDAAALRQLLSKKMVGRAIKREGVTHPQAVMGLSERRSARLSDRR